MRQLTTLSSRSADPVTLAEPRLTDCYEIWQNEDS